MAVPKKKKSKSKTKTREFENMKLKAKSVTTCGVCGEEKLPHRACPNGHYEKHDQKQKAV